MCYTAHFVFRAQNFYDIPLSGFWCATPITFFGIRVGKNAARNRRPEPRHRPKTAPRRFYSAKSCYNATNTNYSRRKPHKHALFSHSDSNSKQTESNHKSLYFFVFLSILRRYHTPKLSTKPTQQAIRKPEPTHKTDVNIRRTPCFMLCRLIFPITCQRYALNISCLLFPYPCLCPCFTGCRYTCYGLRGFLAPSPVTIRKNKTRNQYRL